MKLIRGIHNLSQAPQEGCVLTIGNFDGVHRGHRALLQGLQEEGRKRNLPVMVMLFEPQPLELFATDKRLTHGGAADTHATFAKSLRAGDIEAVFHARFL